MRASVTVVAGALALCTACGNDAGDSTPREAGSVAAVTGEVTALRSSATEPRRLSAGDTVFSDDTITTAPEATVTIALTHNGAQWTLAGDTVRRVDESVAWRAPKGGGEATFVTGDPDRTASAGRHTEAAPDDEREMDQDPAPAATAAPQPPPAPAPKAERRDKRRVHRSSRSNRDKKKDTADSVDGFFDDEAPAEAPELQRAQIVKALAAVMPAVKKCGKDAQVRVKILIGKDGSVTGALPMGKHAKTDLGRCVAGAVREARFPANSGPPSVIYPFKL